MEKVINILKPKPNPQQQLRDWQRKLRRQYIRREEKCAEGDTISSKDELHGLCQGKFVNNIDLIVGLFFVYGENCFHLGTYVSVEKRGEGVWWGSEVIEYDVNLVCMNIEEGVIEEVVNDAVDTALDSEDKEDEIEDCSELPEAIREEKVKQPAQRVRSTVEEEAVAEGVDDVKEIRTRLAKVRS
ncbi:hypothetical protein SESBI_10623 [Sesbania bispinosa]|nr:hypothetical protein SESBI_10623 [Sesbania bispinosa]